MLKKYWFYIEKIFIIAIIIIIFILMKSDPKSSIQEDNNFAINDTSLITKVFLADRDGNTITLDKTGKYWLVNDQFIVRNEAIVTLLSTASKIRIKKPVPQKAFDNVVKFMATTGVYVEFFEGDNMVKSYTIGSNTRDHLGTYMLLDGNVRPYIVHIPSFNGFLSPRYGIQGSVLDVKNWRSTNIFNLSSDEINYIKYTDYLDSSNSYYLKTNPFELINYSYHTVNFNDSQVLKLLNSFKNLNCETFKSDIGNNIDSLVKLNELIVNNDTLTIFRISESDTKDRKYNFTVDRKYAILNRGDIMLIQDYVFNKVLINIDELIQ